MNQIRFFLTYYKFKTVYDDFVIGVLFLKFILIIDINIFLIA